MDRRVRLLLLRGEVNFVLVKSGPFFTLPERLVDPSESPTSSGLSLVEDLGLKADSLMEIFATLDGASWVTAMTGLWEPTEKKIPAEYEWVVPYRLLDVSSPDYEYYDRLLHNIWEIY
jgi:hypothetical protein